MPGKRILLVEDDEDVTTILARCLEVQGYELCLAENAATVYSLLAEKPPDLVLLDAMLPFVSGYEICAQIKQNARTAGIPVIMLSARSQSFEIEKGLRAGASLYITKPFEIADLLTAVKKFLPLAPA
ncbi:MAG: response regulator [Planctomycetes bacterium]|nr:response regulator [Planctomycetota bacterium]